MLNRERCGVIVADHCNLSCTACNHLSPLFKEKFMEPAAFERTAKLLAPYVHFKYLTFQGGEPLLHREINRFLEIGRASRLSDEIHILTNGTFLGKVDEEFWGLVDRVRLSIYPGIKLPPIPPQHAHKVAAGNFDTFKESFTTVRNENPALVKAIKERCNLFDRCYSISGDYLHKCIVGCFIPYGVSHEILTPVTVDGILIDERPALGSEIDAYVNAKSPLQACEFCLGSSGKRFAQTQTPRKYWLDRHQKPVEEQIDPDFYKEFIRLGP